jgi:hypothetical protein
MEHFVKLVLDSAQHKTSLWLRYVDDNFVVWLRCPEKLQNFLSSFKDLKPAIQFTIEIESDSANSFSEVLIIRK